MNVHLINTRHQGHAATSDGDYPGFYGPYASRLKRIDGCFGDFVSYLKREGRYDESIIIVASDHRDSLGEEACGGTRSGCSRRTFAFRCSSRFQFR